MLLCLIYVTLGCNGYIVYNRFLKVKYFITHYFGCSSLQWFQCFLSVNIVCQYSGCNLRGNGGGKFIAQFLTTLIKFFIKFLEHLDTKSKKFHQQEILLKRRNSWRYHQKNTFLQEAAAVFEEKKVTAI